ncbi:MAG: protecting protein DprA [Bacillales bacterium]|jgi:DNA processing protein|nr:protecting protein DprA [Bacillales bacterium]
MYEFKDKLIYYNFLANGNNGKFINYVKNDVKLFNAVKEKLKTTEITHFVRESDNNDLDIKLNPNFKKTNIYDDLHIKGIKVITIFDKEYPDSLLNIFAPPLVFYCKGNITSLNQPSLAIVGTREPTSYALPVLKKIIPKLIENNFVIVSGLAKGVDSISHQLCLHKKNSTIAVLGGGFFHIYPRENIILSVEMERNQLLVSEYPPFVYPAKWRFPERNRIISGLSMGVLVVEAKERSGSLITAQIALDQGKEVFAIPGSIIETKSTGCNKLIQQGAKLVYNAEDIIEEMKYVYNNNNLSNYFS